MASCTTALSATSKRSGCAPLFCSEVHGDGSHGWSMPRVFGLRPQSADHTYGGSVVQIVSKGRWVPNLVPVTPIFKINSTIGDPSSPFLVRTAPRVKVEQQTTIPQQEVVCFRG